MPDEGRRVRWSHSYIWSWVNTIPLSGTMFLPDCKGLAVRGRRQGRDWVEYRSGRDMFLGGRPEQDDLALGIAKRYIAVPHPRRYLKWFDCCESSMLGSGEQIPHNGSLSNVIADHQSPRTSFADVVDRDELYFLVVMGESPFDGQGVMVKAQDQRTLREEEERCGGGAWLEVMIGRISSLGVW